MAYFDRLQQDMRTLGITDELHPPETYRQLVQLADAASGKTNFDKRAAQTIDPQSLGTNFARYALKLYTQDDLLACTEEVVLAETDDKKYGICDRAEYMIASTMMPDMLQQESFASPIVITEEANPVGVLQRSRNARRMVYYALQESGLPASTGCIYQVPLAITSFSSRLPSTSPWQMAASELEGHIDSGRLSIFTMPSVDRRQLDYDDNIEKPGLHRSHQALVARARALMDFARPISVK